MKKSLKSLSILLLLLLANAVSVPSQSDDEKHPVQAELIYEDASLQPGRPFWVGVRLKMEPGWHAYWKNPGTAGMPPQVSWTLPPGFHASPLQWPTPQKFITMDATGYGYENETIFLAQITPPATLEGQVKISAALTWVVCDHESCLPGGSEIAATLPVNTAAPEKNTEHDAHFTQARHQLPKANTAIQAHIDQGLIVLNLDSPIESVDFFPENSDHIDLNQIAIVDANRVILKENSPATSLKGILLVNGADAYEIDLPLAQTISAANASSFEGGLPFALFFAFLGGLILNCMPCVLPVISFKVLSFVKMAGQRRSLIMKHGLAFSFGVILSFWALAGTLLILRSWGNQVGWAFQMQEPLFVAILAAVIFVFSLSLFGVFELGTSFAAKAGQASAKPNAGLVGSFFSGVLATAVATPCTGPFLGAAVGFAVTQPAFQSLLVFTFLGLGMSSPYLMLGIFPGLLRFMPKPGHWMVTFKEIMGFVMIATVLWLIWVFGAETDTVAVFLLLSGFFLMSIGCWIFGKWGTPLKKKTTRFFSLAILLISFAAGGYILVQASTLPQDYISDRLPKDEIAMADASDTLERWIPFSPEKLADLRKQGIPVFVDFTAKWCLICQTNKMVLHQDEVSTKFKEKGVVRMIADWTKKDALIAQELQKHGRSGVPLYLLYGTDKEEKPVILPQVLSGDAVIEELKKI